MRSHNSAGVQVRRKRGEGKQKKPSRKIITDFILINSDNSAVRYSIKRGKGGMTEVKKNKVQKETDTEGNNHFTHGYLKLRGKTETKGKK